MKLLRWFLLGHAPHVGGEWIDGEFGKQGLHTLHRGLGELRIDVRLLQSWKLRRHCMRKPRAAEPHAGREQRHASMVSAVDPDDLNMSETIAKGWNTLPLRTVTGENRVTAGGNFDLRMPAFRGDETVLFAAPFHHFSLAVEDMDKPRFLVFDMTGIAKITNPNVQVSCTHDIYSFTGNNLPAQS